MKYGGNLPSKGEIFEYWKDRIFDHGLFMDWGEPSCWACGFHYEAKYDIKNPNAGWAEIVRCWDRMPLQRCHIIPRSLGGSPTVKLRSEILTTYPSNIRWLSPSLQRTQSKP